MHSAATTEFLSRFYLSELSEQSLGPPQQQLSRTLSEGPNMSAKNPPEDLKLLYICYIMLMLQIHYMYVFTISLYQLHIMHYLPAQVCTMSSPHQHCRGRRSGEQGDSTQVLRHIAGGQPQGTQPRVAVTAVLWKWDKFTFATT